MSGQPGNSSDFVRKLFKMLEDPAYNGIVRWADDGKTFVVLESDTFTKTILPKHFKHSNFASFVRQLNKYDFHKVRQPTEDNSSAKSDVWEFRHPDFQQHKKDALDKIKRKPPAPRKSTLAADDSFPTQQVDILAGQLAESQQQVQQLHDRCNELSQAQQNLSQQTTQLQKIVKNHESVMQNLMAFLMSVEQKRNNQLHFSSASPLEQVTEILGQSSATENLLPKKEHEKLSSDYHLQTDYCTPPNDQANTSVSLQQQAGHNIAYRIDADIETLSYPVAHTNGIDPIQNEHAQNISYAPQPNILLQSSLQTLIPENHTLSKSTDEAGLPNILLVEDDKICSRIGAKFLQALSCRVDVADDGDTGSSMAISRNPSYDLVLMDIMMPSMNGVAATLRIKEFRPHIPIVAMTCNIRDEDVKLYLDTGMVDILPKPFTREGMLRVLLSFLPKNKIELLPSLEEVASAYPVDFASAVPQLSLPMGHMIYNAHAPLHESTEMASSDETPTNLRHAIPQRRAFSDVSGERSPRKRTRIMQQPWSDETKHIN